MLQSEFYLGLPNEIWESFLSETEEVLSEEEIGTHMLGVYPSGSRIYGIESASPQFICLHIDSPEAILNPSIVHHPNNDTGYWNKTIKLDGSKVTFIHLFDWVQWLLHRKNDNTRKLLEMHDLIPCNHDIAYQDQSINDLSLAARKYVSLTDTIFLSKNNGELLITYEQKIEYALYMRTQAVLAQTGRFAPNMNPDWGNVVNLITNKGSDLYEIDKLLQETILKNNNKILDRDLDVYACECRKLINSLIKYPACFNGWQQENPNQKRINKLAEELSQETMKIYRYIL